ncbi:MAG: hypothetical protein AAF744_14975 [Pseudomonadota bacterium]
MIGLLGKGPGDLFAQSRAEPQRGRVERHRSHIGLAGVAALALATALPAAAQTLKVTDVFAQVCLPTLTDGNVFEAANRLKLVPERGEEGVIGAPSVYRFPDASQPFFLTYYHTVYCGISGPKMKGTFQPATFSANLSAAVKRAAGARKVTRTSGPDWEELRFTKRGLDALVRASWRKGAPFELTLGLDE